MQSLVVNQRVENLRGSHIYRPCDSIIASLNDNLGPPAHASHPSEQAIRVDQLVAIHHVMSLTHCRPQSGIRVIIYIGKGHLVMERKTFIQMRRIPQISNTGRL